MSSGTQHTVFSTYSPNIDTKGKQEKHLRNNNRCYNSLSKQTLLTICGDIYYEYFPFRNIIWSEKKTVGFLDSNPRARLIIILLHSI